MKMVWRHSCRHSSVGLSRLRGIRISLASTLTELQGFHLGLTERSAGVKKTLMQACGFGQNYQMRIGHGGGIVSERSFLANDRFRPDGAGLQQSP